MTWVGRAAPLLAALCAIGCVDEVWLGAPIDGVPTPDVIVPPPPPPEPCLVVDPWLLELGVVQEGEVASGELQLSSTCEDAVTVTGFRLSGHPGYTVSLDGAAYPVSNETALAAVDLAAPLVVAPGAPATIDVTFEPSAGKAAHANLVLLSDDPAVGQGLAAKLEANTALPCVVTFPKLLDFGSAMVGGEPDVHTLTVKSCGPVPLTLGALKVEGTESFSVSPVPGAPALPWVLEPGDSTAVTVTFAPSQVAPFGAANLPVREEGTLVLETSAFVAEHEVALQGFGVDQACPEATIAPTLPEEVVPPTLLWLDGSPSAARAGGVAEYLWTVQGPPGTELFLFDPGADVVTPAFELALAGDYLFRLMVWDTLGTPACAPAEWGITAAPGPGLYVELVWDTPSDPDPHDTGLDAGTDLDLHLLHPWAAGLGRDVDGDGTKDGWFDIPFDTCWLNPEPDWGDHRDPKATDDPVLARDDTDGTGPETIVLPVLEPIGDYEIGVHFWADHGFGSADVRVRVWMDGSLAWASPEITMIAGFLWRVATIDGATGEVAAFVGDGCDPCLVEAYAPDLLPKP